MTENDLQNIFIQTTRKLRLLGAPVKLSRNDNVFTFKSFDPVSLETITNYYHVEDWVVSRGWQRVTRCHILQDSCDFVRSGKILDDGGETWSSIETA